jgi:tetratricopeptide (TPR) repeat protein
MATISELFDRAVRYHQSGNPQQAELLYRQILQVDPFVPAAHSNLGLVLNEQGETQQAIECFRQAVRIDPNYLNAHLNLGNALKDHGQPALAEESYRQVLRLNPAHTDAYNNLGIALVEQGRIEEASHCYQQAIQINPDNANVYYNLGNARKDQGLHAQAEECYRQALRINPEHALSHLNLGSLLDEQKLFAEAEECYRKTLQINPSNERALWNLSCLRLLQGDFAGGWPGFKSRLTLPGAVRRPFQQPRWDGSPLNGKTLLLYVERGLGDTIQCLRYLPLVHQAGGSVILEIQLSLLKLVHKFAVDQVTLAGESLPPFDVQIPLFCLPAIFSTTLATIPSHIPYLTVDSDFVERWRRKLRDLGSSLAVGSRLNVGIAWQGTKIFKNDHRSLPLSHFGILAGIEGVRLVSLQVGSETKQLDAATFPIIDLGSRFDPNSLEDLAAALMSLDLVVTVDTAVAHLAGALGVPVWVALPFRSCWRWLLGRSDSPWYPTMQLFRQNNPGDWGDVFERIGAALRSNIKRIAK